MNYLILIISFVLGYVVAHFVAGRKTNEHGRMPWLIFSVGQYCVHVHHWMWSMAILIILVACGWYNDSIYGLLAGLIVQGIPYRDSFRIVYRKKLFKNDTINIKQYIMKKKILTMALIIIGVIMIGAGVMYFVTPPKLTDTTTLGLKVRSQTWSGTITVKGDVTYLPWATVTIEPGTKVLFDKLPDGDLAKTDWTKWADAYIKDHQDPTGRQGYAKTHFAITGKIVAIGTSDQPIMFTSAQTKPEYADWDQLALAKNSHLENIELSYAHNGVTINGNNVTVAKSKIYNSLWSCIDIFSWGNTIEDNEIFHCWHQAIGTKTEAGSNRINTIQRNTVHDSMVGLNCEGTAKPWATNNTFTAAPLDQNCGAVTGNTVTEGQPNVAGGTYAGILIYPSTQ